MSRIFFTVLAAVTLALAAGCAVDTFETSPVGEAAQALLGIGDVCDPNASPDRCCSGVCEKDANLPDIGRCIENEKSCGCDGEPPCA